MTINKGQEVELYIEALVFGGKGLARHNGFGIFVKNTIPGRQFMRWFIANDPVMRKSAR